jgi:hypothetical protein
VPVVVPVQTGQLEEAVADQAMASHLRVVLVHPRKAMPGEQRQTLVWLSTLVVVVVGLLL